MIRTLCNSVHSVLGLRLARSSCVLLFVLLGAPAALAETRVDPAAAEALFRQGRAADEAGNAGLACDKFRESYRLDPAVGTLFNIANCSEQLGQLATAWTLFVEVRDKLALGDDRRTIADERATRLEPKVPHLTIVVEPEGASEVSVVRDGVELGRASWGVALPIDPGTHEIVVTAKGRAAASYSEPLSVGEKRELRVSPGALVEAPAATPPDVVMDRGTDNNGLGYTIAGVGILGLGVSAVTAAMTLKQKDIVDENCDDEKRCSQRGVDAVNTGKNLQITSLISGAAGLVGVGLGGYLILSSTDEDPQQVVAGASAGPEGASISLSGRW